MNEMWYDKEAGIWDEALPLGNGRLGAMVWSGAASEKICLNEDTLWSGYPTGPQDADESHNFKKARDLAMEGKYHEAQEYIEAHLMGCFTQAYMPVGDLVLDMEEGGAATGYRRSLDLETAVLTTSYSKNGVNYKREYFASHPNQVIIMRITSDKAGMVNLTGRLISELQSQVRVETDNMGDLFILDGVAPSVSRPNYLNERGSGTYENEPDKMGMRFAAIASFENHNGTLAANGGGFEIKNADSVTIRLCCRTNFKSADILPEAGGVKYLENTLADIKAAQGMTYDALRANHIRDYQGLYKRVDIDLGTNEANACLPLPERLAKWEEADSDSSLFALLFQYGRYLTIAASRPGTTPMNLQGIWNPLTNPPWSSNYTVNINLEMNYWPTEAANLAECHMPLITFIDVLRKTGEINAKMFYGAGGFVVHHNSDIWGLSHMVGEKRKGFSVCSFWPLGAGWLAAHAFEHYTYSLDKVYLKETAWPIIEGAARFFLDVLTEDTDGSLIFAPSASPENQFVYKGQNCPISKTTAMTVGIVKETLANTVKCCEALGTAPPIMEEAAKALSRMPEHKIGARGELLEWCEELQEAEPEHRHNSHLYALYPARDIKPGTDLAKACARTLDLRGDESTGWALAWRVNLWARLYEADRAYTLLKKQLRPAIGGYGGCYPNLFGAHPPFQIDSNFGACAGIIEMLMQSGDGEIVLLPALPKPWHTGHIKGLRARGGAVVSIWFKGGELDKAELTLAQNLAEQTFNIIYNKKTKKIRLRPGEPIKIGGEDFV